MKSLVLLLLLLCSFSASSIEVISHRANICGLTENSIGAIEKSWLSNIAAVEVDVRISNDELVYLYHDAEIDDKEVARLSYSEVVGLVGEQRAPKLRNVFARTKPIGFYILDLKSPWRGRENVLAKIVKASGVANEKLVIQSHDLELLASIRKLLPKSRYFYLSKLRRKFPLFRAPSAASIAAEIEGAEIDGVSLKGRNFISKEFIETFQKAGLEVFIWTINDIDRFQYYRGLGVDGVITDQGAQFQKVLHNDRVNPVVCN